MCGNEIKIIFIDRDGTEKATCAIFAVYVAIVAEIAKLDELSSKRSKKMIKNENICINLAFELVAEFEGFVDHVYECEAGKQTIGYGSVVENLPQKVQDKIKKEKNITKEEAENIAKDILRNLLKNLEIKYPYLKEHQMAAILDLYYNVGIGNINRSNLPIFLQKQEWNKAIQSILSFCHYRDKNGILQVAKGLQRRRQKEVDLFKAALDKLYVL